MSWADPGNSRWVVSTNRVKDKLIRLHHPAMFNQGGSMMFNHLSLSTTGRIPGHHMVEAISVMGVISMVEAVSATGFISMMEHISVRGNKHAA